MRHKWQKLASLAKKTTCTFYTFCSLVYSLLQTDKLLKNTRKEPTQARKYFMIVNLPLFCI